jgi:hypothetical protein
LRFLRFDTACLRHFLQQRCAENLAGHPDPEIEASTDALHLSRIRKTLLLLIAARHRVDDGVWIQRAY